MASGALRFLRAGVVFWLFLLIHPNLHNDAVGYQLYKQTLEFCHKAVDRDLLFGFIQVVKTGSDHIFRFVEADIVLHFPVIGGKGVVEKFCFYPEGVHCHNADTLLA